MASSQQQTDTWDEGRVARWLAESAQLERQLAPISELLFAAAGLRPGESVLDVGCGTGPTTWDAARRVGADGRVAGLDVAGAMLTAAAQAGPTDTAGLAELTWIEADPVTWEPTDRWDVVLSRFGVMFFSDPAGAFHTLHRATVEGGRLAAVVWAHRDDSPLFTVPLAATLGALAEAGIHPELPEPTAGAYSLHDPEAIATLLTVGGWRDVAVTRTRLPLLLGGGMTPTDAAPAALGFGPTRVATGSLDDQQRDLVVDAVAEALAGHTDAEGHVVLDGTVQVVTARA